MRDLLKQAPPTRFEDIIALVALYRPGPMELIPDYTARKSGRERVDYMDPRLEPILGPTYGVMVYQEQVMQIAQVIGGYTLGGADLLRRAMGKKDQAAMDRQRDIFVAGAQSNGMPEAKASQLFDLMQKFAGYGFNKSHAAAYALIAFQTAYFKAHHPAAFMAANLSLVMDDTDKVRQLHDDALAQGLTVLPPDVNASNFRFEPVDAKQIRYGLGGIKGTGEQAIEAIVAAREEGGPFRDLFDFCRRVDKRAVNRRVVEALIRAGAFDAHRRAPRDAVRVGRHRARRGRARGGRRRAGVAVRRGAARGRARAGRHARVDRRPSGCSTRRRRSASTCRGIRTPPTPRSSRTLVRQPLASLAPQQRARDSSPASSRAARAGEPPRQDGVRHARRRRAASAEIVVYNETFDAVRALLREDQLVITEVKVTQRMTDDGESQGLRIIAENVLRPRRRSASSSRRALNLACNGNARPTRSPRSCAVPPRQHARSSSSTATRRRRRHRAAGRRGASTSTTR